MTDRCHGDAEGKDGGERGTDRDTVSGEQANHMKVTETTDKQKDDWKSDKKADKMAVRCIHIGKDAANRFRKYTSRS